MTDQTENKKPTIQPIILFPYLLGIPLAIIGGVRTDDIFLDPVRNFTTEILTTLALSLLHIAVIGVLIKHGKIKFELPQTQAKSVLSIALQFILVLVSSFILGTGLWVNLNYSLKSSTEKNIELVVTAKSAYHSKGRKTYLINFTSNDGMLRKEVTRKEYPNISVGDTYAATVQEGHFEGYFLTKPLNRIKD
jgi:succinate dehydrogenase hydrophobic anchor subunit